MSRFADNDLRYIEITSVIEPLPKNPIEYLSSLTNDKLISLLGIEGAKAFRRNPKTWRRYLRQYAPDTDKPTVPKKFFKVEGGR